MTDPGTGAEDLTADDQFVESSDNGLRPEDEELEQPPQDPNFVPESAVDAQGNEVAS